MAVTVAQLTTSANTWKTAFDIDPKTADAKTKAEAHRDLADTFVKEKRGMK